MSGHITAGRLALSNAEIGAVLGPKVVTREFVVVTEAAENGVVTVGYARTDDLGRTAVEAIVARGPRSIAEHRLIAGFQHEERTRLAFLFGGAL